LKLFQESGKRVMKERGGRGEFKYDLVDNMVRTIVNVTMYPHPAQ
jgi:hypothetical protein